MQIWWNSDWIMCCKGLQQLQNHSMISQNKCELSFLYKLLKDLEIGEIKHQGKSSLFVSTMNNIDSDSQICQQDFWLSAEDEDYSISSRIGTTKNSKDG